MDQQKQLQKDINKLDRQAREHEKWLEDNTEDPNFLKRHSEYCNVLFRLNQKREQQENQSKDVPYYETKAMPRVINRSENVTR
jgi:RNA processing factor Prp31